MQQLRENTSVWPVNHTLTEMFYLFILYCTCVVGNQYRGDAAHGGGWINCTRLSEVRNGDVLVWI